MPKGAGKKRAEKAVTAANGIVDLQKELFQAAMVLCGSIEPAGYKRYVKT